jgi:hypothetical protein
MNTQHRPWLEQTYHDRRQRTVGLTRSAISHLRSINSRVSLSLIVTASRLVDEAGRGISSSAILANDDAMKLYVEARDWRPTKEAPIKTRSVHPLVLPLKTDRDLSSVRTRLRRLTKNELIGKVIQLEQALGEMRQILVQQHSLVVAAHPSVR